MMTPQEQFEHKLSWRSVSSGVTIHSDLRGEYKTWLKKNCVPSEYSVQEYTDVYQDTVLFEHATASEQFRAEFEQWCEMGS